MLALMLLTISLRRSAPKSNLHIPARDMPEHTRSWFASQSNVVLHRDLWPEDTFWNIKPHLLEQLLDRGVERATWIDGDIIVTSDPAKFFRRPETEIVVAQEGFRSRERGTGERTIAIGGRIGRELGYTVNSCIVSVTPRHRDLLNDWKLLLRSELYRNPTRHPLLVGDQDVLGGLLGSSGYADVPVSAVRTAGDIAHDMLPGDFGVMHRIATVWTGEPAFAHSQGRKTWRMPAGSLQSRHWLNQLAMHRQWAKAFASELPKEMSQWLTCDTGFSKLMSRLFPSRPSLRGLPVGLVGSSLNCAYRVRNLFRNRARYSIGQPADEVRPL